MMGLVREDTKNDVPELWKQRYKIGACPVCGKDSSDFKKGMKVYCSHECRDEFASKFTTWTEVKDKILKRDNRTCQKCSMTPEKHREQFHELRNNALREWAETHKKEIDNERDYRLVRLSKEFEKDHKQIMDDVFIADRLIDYHELKKMAKTPEWGTMEVDHIVAVALGGDMWDEKNMQTLCDVPCHKEKTKEDMKKIVAERRIKDGQKKL